MPRRRPIRFLLVDDVARAAEVRAMIQAGAVSGLSIGFVTKAASPRPLFAGTPQEVADGLQLWFEQRGADGFIIQGGTPDTFPRFVDRVVPILQARGLFRREYPGTTLRESLGLTQPVNQFQQQ